LKSAASGISPKISETKLLWKWKAQVSNIIIFTAEMATVILVTLAVII
jgi:hypothetical protein